MRLVRTFAVALAAGLLFTACSAGDTQGDAAEAPAAAEAEIADDVTSDSDDSGGEAGSAASGGTISKVANVDPSPRYVIYTIDLVIETEDVAQAAAQAADLAEKSGGFVESESTEGNDSARLTLRVPSTQHTSIVREIEELGDVRHRDRDADDVRDQVVDIEARVASQRRSIERIRELLDRAGDLTDLVRIESELAAREADLDSLLRRQEELSSLTRLATINVRFYKTDEAPADIPEAVGFMSGLSGGWTAFVATVRVVGAAAGALLPFAGAAALLGIPAWLVWRRRRPAHGGRAEPPQPPAPAQPVPQPEG